MSVRSALAVVAASVAVGLGVSAASSAITTGPSADAFVESAVEAWTEPVPQLPTTRSTAATFIPSPGSAVLFTMAIGVVLTRKRKPTETDAETGAAEAAARTNAPSAAAA